MAIVTIPNRPAGTSIRSIEQVLADFDAITAQVNGNLDDTNLASPMAAKRQLVLQAQGALTAGFAYSVGGQDFLLEIGSLVASGNAVSIAPPVFAGDLGWSGNPQDFQVPNKSGKARVRASILCCGATPGVNIAFGLYQLTSLSTNIFNFGAALVGSAVSIINPLSNVPYTVTSPEFTLPVSGNYYALGVNLSGGAGNVAGGTTCHITSQLYCYNS